ncbi:MAG: hypothetical protein BGO68_01070 [Candidatus Amoebophilus sp. 36-38]|nr:MAG: hypothetical protein BGO68_01070 [Candidatus Amoebophilus sp. 36-38]
MNNTMFIQIVDAKAEQLLYNLEDLHLIRVLAKPIQTKQKLSEKYAGKLPSQMTEALEQYIAQSRSQWNERSI